MTIGNGKLILLKNIPSERYVAYKDRHRPIHAHNQEVIKKRLKVEKRLIERYEEKKQAQRIERERKDEKLAVERYRLLNII